MKSVWTIVALFTIGGCEVFVSGVGGVGGPCFGDGTCGPGLICNGGRCSSAFKILSGGFFMPGNSSTQMKVTPFSIMDREVTLAWYAQCVSLGPCSPPGTDATCVWGERAGLDEDKHKHKPVNCVSWAQAQEFCSWKGFRLPTEVEWEFAARAGGQDILYPWGNSPAPDCGNCNSAGCSVGGNSLRTVCEDSSGNTVEGVCDLAGNVAELVADVRNDLYAEQCGQGQHVARGGSYRDGSGHCVVSDRQCLDGDNRDAAIGFRCVWDNNTLAE